MNGFIRFHRGIFKMPLYWQLWLVLLVSANLMAPLFFIERIEAQIVLGTILASMALMVFLTGRFGFTRILGFGHVLWIPMLTFLLMRLGDIPSSEPAGLWLRTLILLNSVSLLIDAVDVVRYVNGDRAETVNGL